MSLESQRSIVDWADWTFGPVAEPLESALRADSEMKEFRAILNEALAAAAKSNTADPRDSAQRHSHFGALCDEAADIVICLFRMCHVMGADLGSEIDRKMAINRKRRWQSDGTGHGSHIREATTRSKPTCNHKRLTLTGPCSKCGAKFDKEGKQI